MFSEPVKLIAKREDPILVLYDRDFTINNKEYLFKLLERDVIYNSNESSKVKIFGVEHEIPRKQVAYGDPGTTYTFAGVTVSAMDWNKNNELCNVLTSLRNKVAKYFNFNPNFVLINRYEDGEQYIGYHSDDEKDLDLNSPIVGISLGSEREMLFKSKKTGNVIPLMLTNGSAYCMFNPTNSNYKHSIPKRKGVKCPRISLTFREMKIKNNII